MVHNYFADLELSVEASVEEIRQAYRRLARRFHPDLNPMDMHAEESFKRVREAFDYLNSEDRAKKLRDKILKSGSVKKPEKWHGSVHFPKSPESFVNDWTEEPSYTNLRVQRKENLEVHVRVSMKSEELSRNCEKRIVVEYEKPCTRCLTKGRASRKVQETCKHCSGLGFLSIQRGALQWKKTCDDCRGCGTVRRTECQLCLGSRKIRDQEFIKLDITKAVDISKPLIFEGLGHVSFDGKRRGSLWVHLQVSN